MWKFAQWGKHVKKPILSWVVAYHGYRDPKWAQFYRGQDWRIVFDIGDMVLIEGTNTYVLWMDA